MMKDVTVVHMTVPEVCLKGVRDTVSGRPQAMNAPVGDFIHIN
jgi:hypothetical protein